MYKIETIRRIFPKFFVLDEKYGEFSTIAKIWVFYNEFTQILEGLRYDLILYENIRLFNLISVKKRKF